MLHQAVGCTCSVYRVHFLTHWGRQLYRVPLGPSRGLSSTADVFLFVSFELYGFAHIEWF